MTIFDGLKEHWEPPPHFTPHVGIAAIVAGLIGWICVVMLGLLTVAAVDLVIQ